MRDTLIHRPDSLALRVLLCTALALVLLCILVLAGVPPVDRDALTHHLAVPKLYLRHGGIYEIPAVPFSYYPMNLDLLYMAALHLGSDILPKYIHCAFGLLTAGMLFAYLRKRLQSTTFGLLGCLLFLSLPVIVKLSVTVYVDLGLIFFSTAALLQLFRWAESGFQMRHLLLSGVLTGLCLGTKYNGMLCAFLLGLVVLILPLRAPVCSSDAESMPSSMHKRRSSLHALWYAVVFCAAALAVFSPWMTRNYAWTGNPVYPMADGLWGASISRTSDNPEYAEEADHDRTPTENAGSGLNHFALRTVVFEESLLDILLIPVRIFFQGADDDPQHFDGRLNPYLLFFPIAALALTGRRRWPPALVLEQQLMAGFAVVYLLLSFLLTDMRVRYVAPILPPLVLLTVFGIHDLQAALQNSTAGLTRRCGSVGILASLVVLLALNGSYIQDLMGRVQPFSYLTGKVSRDEYIQKRRPEYAANAYINRNLTDDSRILCLFTGNRIYYSDREMVCDSELFRHIIRSAPSPEAVRERLLQLGISHLLLHGPIFTRWADSQFDDQGRGVLQSLFKQNLRSIFASNDYYLFQIMQGSGIVIEKSAL
jgi:hypothetical protein